MPFVPGGWFGGWLGVVPYWHHRPDEGYEEGRMGVTDGSNAAPGEIGEVQIWQGSQTMSANGTIITPIVLSAGDWDFQALAYWWTTANDNLILNAQAWLSLTSDENANYAFPPFIGRWAGGAAEARISTHVPAMRFNSASATSFYLMLSVAANFSAGHNVGVDYYAYARRMR